MPDVGQELHDLAAELFPLPRSLTGPAVLQTLDVLEQRTGPMQRHRWRTGERVHDWTVPDAWALRDAWLRGPDGRDVLRLADSTLHVLGYSEPVRRRLPLAELQEHLHSLPDQPGAIPYLTSYYKRRWGLCLAHDVREALPDGEYEVCIDADLGPGELVLGEVVLPGATDREVLLSTYVCHPSLANNELSGPVIAALLARELRGRELRHTYRFVFAPETIGPIAWLSRFGEGVADRVVAGWVLTCAGDPAPFTYKPSRRGGTLADRAAEHVLRHSGAEHRFVDFFPAGSDERQWCSPGYDLPVGSLMRSMYGTYPEYHTSLDDLSLITPQALGESFAAYLAMIDVLEANRTWRGTVLHGEPQLGPRGLYPSLGSQRSTTQALDDLMGVLNLCDGTRDLLAVADRLGRPIAALAPVAERLAEAGLLEEQPA